MEKKVFDRRTKEKLPVLAICYDFDKTLSPDDMQAQGYIQSVNYDVKKFWSEVNSLAENNDMDQNLAYMYKMVEEAEGNIIVTKKALNEYGAKVKLFDGAKDWFSRIRKYGEKKGVIVEHYIISSGLKEMIEGTTVANEFEKIYASSFFYNEKGVAVWPSQVINYTNKTQFLFRISKGVLDVNDNGVNDYFAPENLRVPFRNMVYIGDSDTDIPCMKLINDYGGYSVGVFNKETMDKSKVFNMMRDNRIKFFTPADYTENSELDKLVKLIIDRTASNETLEEVFNKCKKENETADDNAKKLLNKKTELIKDLSNSHSFKESQTIIKELCNFTFTSEEKEELYKIAITNSQIHFILGNKEIKEFYLGLIGDDCLSKNAKKVVDSTNKYYQGKPKE